MKVWIVEEDARPDYGLYQHETDGAGFWIEIDEELYDRYARVSDEYCDIQQKELAVLYEEYTNIWNKFLTRQNKNRAKGKVWNY